MRYRRRLVDFVSGFNSTAFQYRWGSARCSRSRMVGVKKIRSTCIYSDSIDIALSVLVQDNANEGYRVIT